MPDESSKNSNSRLARIRAAYDKRRPYIYLHSFPLWVGVLSVISGLIFFVHPASIETSSLGIAFRNSIYLPYIWNSFLTFGGAAIVYGILNLNRMSYAMGLYLFSGGVLINAVSILVVRGLTGLATIPVLVGFVIAALMQVRVVLGKL